MPIAGVVGSALPPAVSAQAGDGWERLRALVERDALLGGDYTLSSGSSSLYYFDSKPVTLSPAGARLVGEAFLGVIRKNAPEADAVGGLTLGADPIVTSIALLSAGTEQLLKGLIVRKEPKAHGTTRLVEGPTKGVKKVVVVDDVVTSGGSAKLAVEGLRGSGLEVVLAVALVDRLEGFEAAMAGVGVPSLSIYTVDDFRKPARQSAAA